MRRSHGYDVDQTVKPNEVVDISRIEPGRMCMCCSGDQQIQRAGSGFSTRLDNRRGDLAVAGRDSFVNRQRIKCALEYDKSTQTLGPDIARPRDKDSKVELSQRHRADCEFAVERSYLCGYDDARVEDGPHVVAHGSRRS